MSAWSRGRGIWGVLLGPGGFSLLGGVCLVWGGILLGPGGFSLVPGGSPYWGVSAWSGGGWVLLGPGGFSLLGGVCLVQGVLPARGGCLPGLGGFSLVPGGSPCWEVSAWSRGFSLWGGVCLVLGGSPEIPPVDRITDACKNITLATTSLRPVTRMHSSEMRTACSLLYKGSLSGWGSLSGGVSVWGSLSGGVFFWGSLSGGSLSRESPWTETPQENMELETETSWKEHGTRQPDRKCHLLYSLWVHLLMTI